jgi:hypothetical protein
MTTTARLQIFVQTSGDIVYTQIANIIPSTNSVAEAQVRRLLPGDNDVMLVESGIPPLAAGGYTLRGVLIVPEPSNTSKLRLKGAPGDVGIILNATDPSFLAIDYTPQLIINNPSEEDIFIKFVWI